MKYLNKNYLICIGSCLSQLAYTIITDCDNPNLSICGEAYANRNKSKLRKLWYLTLNFVFSPQKDHCKWAYDNDLEYSKKYLERDAKLRTDDFSN